MPILHLHLGFGMLVFQCASGRCPVRARRAHCIGSLDHLDPLLRMLGQPAMNAGKVFDELYAVSFAAKALQAQ
jgi:hypothetical protein